MRYPSDQKERTRQRILEAAGRVFRRSGFHAAGIDGVMAEANLTAGAFYGHFESKDALLRELIGTAVEQTQEIREKGLDDLEGMAWIEGLVRRYLSVEHLERVEDGCPVPALLSELPRSSEATRATFERVMQGLRDRVVAHLVHLPDEQREPAARFLMAAMIGGLTVARAAITRDDAERTLQAAADQALAAVRESGSVQ